MKKLATGAATAVVLSGLGAIALAGEPGSQGGTNLILQVKASPPRAGTAAKPQPVGIDFSVRQYTDNGLRGSRTTRAIAFRFNGFTFHPEAFPKCLESKLEKTGPSACPSGSRLGGGNAIADARPTLPNPVPAKAQAFNGTLDIDEAGKPIKPVPAILVYAEGPNNLKSYIPTLFKGKDGLITAEGQPPAPGSQGLFTITALKLTLPVKTAKVKGKTVGFLEAPRTCTGGQWKFSQVNTYFDNGPSITALDSQPCVRR